MIDEAEALLRRASVSGSFGRYQLEGALRSGHVYRCRTGHANWAEVVQLYDALFALAGSPVVAINRALAMAEVHGTSAALAAMQEVAADGRLAEYQPYWATRAELLAKTGAHAEARHAYEIAIGLERDASVRRFLAAASVDLGALTSSRSALGIFSIHFEVVPDHYLSMIGFLNLTEQLVIGDAAVGSAAGGVIDN